MFQSEAFWQDVVMKYFGACTQLELVIRQMLHFCDVHRENWTRSKWRYQKVEKTFARNLVKCIVGNQDKYRKSWCV